MIVRQQLQQESAQASKLSSQQHSFFCCELLEKPVLLLCSACYNPERTRHRKERRTPGRSGRHPRKATESQAGLSANSRIPLVEAAKSLTTREARIYSARLALSHAHPSPNKHKPTNNRPTREWLIRVTERSHMHVTKDRQPHAYCPKKARGVSIINQRDACVEKH